LLGPRLPASSYIDAILGPNGRLAHARAGFEHRPGQLAMAAAVDDVLRTGGVLLAEAGTGTGKTLAYLVPVLFSGRRVVISTATRPLQAQIAQQDVPRLAQDAGRMLRVAMLKGRRNYLCLLRLDQMEPTDDLELRAQQATIQAWREETPDGDRSGLAHVPEDAPIWASLTVGGDACLKTRCAFYEECFVTRAKKRAAQADVIVVNHHLYFADVALRAAGGSAVPDHDTVIFDEAHAVPEVAGLFFGRRVDSGQVERLLADTRTALSPGLVAPARTRARAFFTHVRPAEGGRAHWDPHDVAPEIEAAFLALDDALDGLASTLDALEEETPSIARLRARFGEIRNALSTFFAPDHRDATVWFCEGHGPAGAALSMQPVSPAEHLHDRLFDRMRAVVAVSATLAVGDDFEYARRRLGAPLDAQTLRFDSPFDYSTQARLYLPTHLPPPTDANYLPALVEEVGHLCQLTGGGALVLFTSLRDMRAAFEGARGRINFPLEMQGQAPRSTLLKRLQTVAGTVLFATSSFWTGVDVPGDALSCVIIARLPFGSPADPVLQAQLNAAREAGRDPFESVQLPAAAITLKQGVGRLIRTSRDRGIVAVLDGRLSQRRYGPALLAALPPMPRISRPVDLMAWWHSGRADV
jgi:ATP-dependent DNA helicase DinG